ncbi:Gfo/Idh/MocA family protein [Haloarcula nitratireducens]|uniref:Gfo/Idh/MocA family oxidoreductase n=1 Tax=Haloarcula nitratireducens TaxID=2487749 RepID=A0AAW4P8X7_9EURY|nr:Gfo/Idh/MocA family oxidoreductase [Halomicroarcula nitratireducens]MBX0294043.1 Gfo/Idh/MocA family oxidoreductase [Halomicroarcula nitratireducens]
MTLESAVVGGGTVSDFHLSGLEKCPATNLVAICDVDESRARKKATEYDISAYADFEGMLAREDLDWIHLCTPVQTHLDLARMAIEDGLAVQIEKPVTTSVAEAEELEKLARQHDVPVSVVHNHNFDPAVRKASKLIEAGAIGDVRSVDLLYSGETYPDDVRRGAWAFDLPGGEFEEGLPHPVYLVLKLGGYPVDAASIQSQTERTREYEQGFDYDSASFQYTSEDGVLCSGTVLASDVPHKAIRVHGERGSLDIDIVSQSVTVLDKDYEASPKARAQTNIDHVLGRVQGTVENVVAVARRALGDDWTAERDLDSHYYQIDADARAIIRGDPMPVPIEEGTWTMRIMESVRAAAVQPIDDGQIRVNTDSA